MNYKNNFKTDLTLLRKAIYWTLLAFCIMLMLVGAVGTATGQDSRTGVSASFHEQANARIEFLNDQGFGIDNEELAGQTGLKESTIQAILLGKSEIVDKKLLSKFCEVLKCKYVIYTNYKGMRSIKLIPYEQKKKKKIKVDTLFSKKTGRVVRSSFKK